MVPALRSSLGTTGPAFGLILFACAAALAFAKLAIAGAREINRRTLYYLGSSCNSPTRPTTTPSPAW